MQACMLADESDAAMHILYIDIDHLSLHVPGTGGILLPSSGELFKQACFFTLTLTTVVCVRTVYSGSEG